MNSNELQPVVRPCGVLTKLTQNPPLIYLPVRELQRAVVPARTPSYPLPRGLFVGGGGGQPSPALREGFAAAAVVFYGSVARVNWRGEIYGRSAAASRAAGGRSACRR